MKRPRAVVRAYCICGGALTASSSPPDVARGIEAWFHEFHRGDGHARCDAAMARRARAAAERRISDP